MKKLYHGFCWIEETLCNIGFGAMIALVFISAIARNLGRPLAWSIDVAQLMLCWTTLIGADVAFRHGKFLGLDLVTRRLPIKVQRALALVIDFLILGERRKLEAFVPDPQNQLFLGYAGTPRDVHFYERFGCARHHLQDQTIQCTG